MKTEADVKDLMDRLNLDTCVPFKQLPSKPPLILSKKRRLDLGGSPKNNEGILDFVKELSKKDEDSLESMVGGIKMKRKPKERPKNEVLSPKPIKAISHHEIDISMLEKVEQKKEGKGI